MTGKVINETRSPQVEASIADKDIQGCLVDGGAAVNVMAKWMMEDLELSPIKHTNLRLKVADQRSIKCLGLLSQIPTTINGVTVKIDFHVLGVSEARGGYPIILGRPWLKAVRAIHNWKKGNMQIGTHQRKVKIQVSPNPTKSPIPSSSEEDTSDHESESPWTSEESCTDTSDESEVELFALDTLPQVVTDSMDFLEDDSVVPARTKEILELVQFGPSL